MAEISDEMYEKLRQILEKQTGRPYTFEEAQELGDQLIEFYRILGDDGHKQNDLNENNSQT